MARNLTCLVVTPEQTALEQEADFVALPLYDGEIGIGRDHAPLIGRLGYGEMRLTSGGTTKTFYVDGGFVQVANNVVSVLTNRAVAANEVDAAAAQTQLQDAMNKPATTDELLAIRERNIAQARAQLRVAKSRK
jgi:F-type H+-transporting ATPase subunit epsilon